MQSISRTPQGVRGLKYQALLPLAKPDESHPARGAWIEIVAWLGLSQQFPGRTPQGVRGLK